MICDSDFVFPPHDLEIDGEEPIGKKSEEGPQYSVFDPGPNKNPNAYQRSSTPEQNPSYYQSNCYNHY